MQTKSLSYYVKRAVLALIAIVLLSGSFYQVSASERAIVTRFGAVVGTSGEGLHLKVPFVHKVEKFNIQVQKEQTAASAASSDLQTVSAVVAVNYSIDSTKLTDLYTRIGANYKEKVIDPKIQETVKAITANYTAEQLITKRAEVTTAIQQHLTEALEPSYIIVATNGVNIVNFDFSGQFNAAIEAKVTAEQNALAAKNKLAQTEYEAQQTIVTAKAEAEAQTIKARALESSGGKQVVELEALKVKAAAVAKWNGAGCTSYCGLEASSGLLINAK